MFLTGMLIYRGWKRILRLRKQRQQSLVEPDANVEVMNLDNNQNEISRLKEQADSARKQQTDLDGIGIPEILNLSGER